MVLKALERAETWPVRLSKKHMRKQISLRKNTRKFSNQYPLVRVYQSLLLEQEKVISLVQADRKTVIMLKEWNRLAKVILKTLSRCQQHLLLIMCLTEMRAKVLKGIIMTLTI